MPEDRLPPAAVNPTTVQFTEAESQIPWPQERSSIPPDPITNARSIQPSSQECPCGSS